VEYPLRIFQVKYHLTKKQISIKTTYGAPQAVPKNKNTAEQQEECTREIVKFHIMPRTTASDSTSIGPNRQARSGHGY